MSLLGSTKDKRRISLLPFKWTECINPIEHFTIYFEILSFY